jgi:hypothetical protein
VHAANDGAVPVENSTAYYEALLKYKIYSEMLLYPYGGMVLGCTTRLQQINGWIT